MLSQLAAMGRGAHWEFDQREARVLGASVGGMLEYLPVPSERMGLPMAIASFLLASASIIGTRVMYDRKLHQAGAKPVEYSQVQQQRQAAAMAVDEQMRREWDAYAQSQNAAAGVPPAGPSPEPTGVLFRENGIGQNNAGETVAFVVPPLGGA